MRTGALLLGCLALLSPTIPSVAGAAPVQSSGTAVAAAPGDSTTLGGRCVGGGRSALQTTERATPRSYRVDGKVRKQDEGSRWRGALAWFSDSAGDERRFRAQAVNGSWSRTGRFDGVTRDALFFFEAQTRRDHGCLMLLFSDDLAGGATFCRARTLNFLVVSRRPARDEIALQFALLGVRRTASGS